MEGVAGIVRPEQTLGGHDMYDEGRKLYTEEINAAVRGAKAAGAKEIVVMDHHGAGEGWSFNSLVHDMLDPACEYVVQSSWTQYTEFLEGGVDACLLVGMHAMAGTPDGVMNHTVSGRDWHNLRFNGVAVGESAINAAMCGNWGWRRGGMPRGEGAARRRPDHRPRQEGHQLTGGAQPRPAPRARGDRGGGEERAQGSRRREAV